MAHLFAPIFGLFTGGGAAAGATAGATAATAGTAAAAGGGLSLATILQGGATVLGVLSAFNAGNQDAAALEAQAADAESQQALETLKGIDRRTEARKAVLASVGAIDTAYAASGVDLSFGTVNQARSDTYREGDYAVATSGNTEAVNTGRLAERARTYRMAAKRAKSNALLEGLIGGLQGFSSIARRY